MIVGKIFIFTVPTDTLAVRIKLTEGGDPTYHYTYYHSLIKAHYKFSWLSFFFYLLHELLWPELYICNCCKEV